MAAGNRYRMLSIAEAQDTVLKAITPLGSQNIALAESVGYILAKDVHAIEPLPPFPASIKVDDLPDLGFGNYAIIA